MKKVLIALVLALVVGTGAVSASPQLPPPELWVMDADGTDQRMVAGEEHGLEAYDEFSWAPDSRRIVASGIVIVEVDTGTVTPLTSGRDPNWSPNSDEIVFSDPISTQTSYDENLYLIDADGSDRRLFVDMPQLASSPVWDPAGERVAFVSGLGSGQEAEVFVVNSDGAGVTQVTRAGSLYTPPVWSPDGDRLVFETFDHQLYMVNADGTGERPLGNYAYSSQPTWCPDGTLYFVAYRQSDERPQIYSLTEDGNEQVVTGGGHPDCSASGRLALARVGDVHVMDPGEPGEPNLTNSDDRDDLWPSWAPDGSKIAFVSFPGLPDPTPVERDTTLSLRKHLVARGTLRPTGIPCGATVALQKITEDGWKSLAKVDADDAGRFRVKLPDREGYYRAVARRHHFGFGEYDCLRAVSEVIRHAH